MFSKFSVVVASVLVTLVAARPGSSWSTPPVTPPSSPQCCNSVLSSTDTVVSAVAGLLGLDLSGLNVPIGLGCSPITVIGNNCGSTTVNCDAPQESWGGLIAINCIPITL
ncbi:fungal hydrophobin [Mycena polygramma]|nr:fungal hydrophobin [Mycena polygramma]KAJ7663142.1 fungal hydrophobin [Mycena polygramma]